MKLPKVSFNANAFSRTLIARKAERGLGDFFDQIGVENVVNLVTRNMNILDLVPVVQKAEWKSKASEYSELFPSFSDEDVYGWIPNRWRSVIESVSGGRAWGLRQIAQIRQAALA